MARVLKMTVLLSFYQYQNSRTAGEETAENLGLNSDKMLGEWGSVEIEASPLFNRCSHSIDGSAGRVLHQTD